MKWRLLNIPYQLYCRVIHLPLESVQNCLVHLRSLVLFHSGLFNSPKDFGFHHFLLGSIPESCKLHCPEVFHISGKFSIFCSEHFFQQSGWLNCSHAKPQSAPVPINQLLTATAEMMPFPNEDTPPFPLNGCTARSCN